MMGPPANPNLIGALMPGKEIGMAPTIKPSTMPMNTATRLGSFKLLTALPNTRSTLCKAAASPTTVRRSPI